MMQFSWAPWRLLSKENQELCLGAARLHKKFAEYIKSEVARAALDGEPIVRALEYSYPNEGFECTVDAFMLGERYLVCPVIKQGEVKREVKLPVGKWLYRDGTIYDGGKTVCVSAPLGVLPYFEKIQ
jgi:alpha-glucosidase